ncbi:MAG TPA: hypothetical protein VFY17_02680 [Pilimelia sp.]|nr:hypothetical protein [Pilimelia sp.]
MRQRSAPTRTRHSTVTRAPDGRRVTVAAVASAPPDDWFWSLRITGPAASAGVTVGRAGYAALRSADFPVAAESLTYRGEALVLRTGGPPLDRRWCAALAGPYRDLMVAGTGPAPRLADVVSLLDEVRPRQFLDALVLDPLPGVRLWGLCGRCYVPGVGTLTTYPRDEAAGLVPAVAGKPVSGGRLWYTDAGFAPGGGGYFLHAAETAVTMVRDERGVEPDASDAAVADLLDSLHVEWS